MMRHLLAVAVALAGCSERERPSRHDPFDVELRADELPERDPDEPRFTMERVTDRCIVVIESGPIAEKLPTMFACPKDLELGEKVHLVGRTCMRESIVKDRNVPVLCPDYLTNAERESMAAPSSSAVRH